MTIYQKRDKLNVCCASCISKSEQRDEHSENTPLTLSATSLLRGNFVFRRNKHLLNRVLPILSSFTLVKQAQHYVFTSFASGYSSITTHFSIVCCQHTIVCSQQTIVSSRQTIVCCQQTINNLISAIQQSATAGQISV